MNSFINPYNFIPLMPKEPVRANISEEERGPEAACREPARGDRHTGVIEYTITTKTPLFIPNSSNDHAFRPKEVKEGENQEHKSYDFFSYTQLEQGSFYNDEYHRPVIPGSELRGCIRNIYETLTGSCMSVLNEDTAPVKRTGEIFLPALIHREQSGEYELFEAKACRTRIGKSEAQTQGYHEGEAVYFNYVTPGERGNPSPRVQNISKASGTERRGGSEIGYILAGEWKGDSDGSEPKQKHVHVFVPGEFKRPFSGSDFKELEKVVAHYRAQASNNPYEDYCKRLEEFKKGRGEGYFPVYYSKVTDEAEKRKTIYYFSPAQITKEAAHTTIGAAAGGFKPCADAGRPCPACALFGMVGKSSNGQINARASGLRFSDAVLKQNTNGNVGSLGGENEDFKNLYDVGEEGCVTLPPLSSPKPSNAEFYLKRPDGADFWTYDYYIKDGKTFLYEPTLKGRKFYWHQPDMKLGCSAEATKLNMTVRPLKRGITFSGKLFFDGISDKQLKQLLWIVNGGSDSEKKLDYKLGAAKPLGLGSVEFCITRVLERKISKVADDSGNEILQYKNVERYGGDANEAGAIDIAQLKYNDRGVEEINDLGFMQEIKKAFMKICSFDALKNEKAVVSYPVTLEQYNAGQCEEGFKWFTDVNHTGVGNKKMRNRRTQEKLVYSLPGIPDIMGKGDVSLPMGTKGAASERGAFNRAASERKAPDCTAPECATRGCHNPVNKNPYNGGWFKYCRKCSMEHKKPTRQGMVTGDNEV